VSLEVAMLQHAGDIFYVPAEHDSWVIGNEQYVSLHLIGAGVYTR
jgi:hypothetical protein